ncbi:MAG: phage tail assembly chaperone [Hyphomicrobiales bacterium]|nr:MAG: phage tail assembly chaperone [Hyphomicrobiales bacterium]
MAFGLGVARLSPTAFWALSVPELVAMTGAGPRSALPPDRADLARLMASFPDRGQASRMDPFEGENHHGRRP